VARTRTTKKLAQRIDLNYFKRPTPLKRAKFWLSLLLPVLALVWIAWRGLSGDHRVYSSGPMSEPHAVLEKECVACHAQKAGAFSAKAADSACLDCHDGPIHHAMQTSTPACATCHTEHRGRINIAAARNQVCAECHEDLKASGNSAAVRIAHPKFRRRPSPIRGPSRRFTRSRHDQIESRHPHEADPPRPEWAQRSARM